MNATDALESLVGDALFLGASLTVTQWSVALFTTAPLENGTGGVEVSTSGTGYSRVTILADASHWNKVGTQDGSGRTVYQNAAQIQYPNPTANWNSVSHLGLYNESNVLCFVIPLAVPRTVLSGELGPVILAGELQIAIG